MTLKTIHSLLLSCFLLGLYLPSALAQVYKWVDEDGVVHFSDKPPVEQPKETDSPSNQSKHISESRAAERLVSKSTRWFQSMSQSQGITLTIRQLLRQRKYEYLNIVLEDLQSASELSYDKELELFTAYKAFRLDSNAYISLLDEWITYDPSQYYGYLAKAEYFYGAAWRARGTKAIKDTSADQLTNMKEVMLEAKEQLELVQNLFADSMVSYGLQIAMANSLGDESEVAIIAKKALEIKPASYYVRAIYLRTLTPRWGGSFEKMELFFKESSEFIRDNPKLTQLQGLIFLEAGQLASLQKRYDQAESIFDRALLYGDNDEVLANRGKSRYRQGKYQEALDDLNRAIGMSREYGEYYHWRGKIYSAMKQYSNSLSDFERAAQLMPNDKDLKQHRQRIETLLAKQSEGKAVAFKRSKALDQLDDAIKKEPSNALHYYSRSLAYIELKQYDSAVEDLKKAITHNPHEYQYYLSMDWLLIKRRDWKQIIYYWDIYLNLYPKDHQAYLERSGAYFHQGNIQAAARDAKMSAKLGNKEALAFYEELKQKL
ncbi:hypothetical protein Ssed_0851 [Shewanella sediminis HAW-EB3]|uniref:DUF4124 domain-containing protein n=1 Tax=Shewanella sediminis (strain HAW-EB3) TaxID=425104 RepID=A8FRI9_SHESH|nr:tetratricopeptide repeat protein [Shewanella sediminis]ABV35462.1 hypothetical protein Ssed_0851 [Shewanella sediminis HAW-EB3]